MRAFYVIAFLVVVVLGLAPFSLLPKPPEVGRPGEVVLYDTLPAKVKSIDPGLSATKVNKSGLDPE